MSNKLQLRRVLLLLLLLGAAFAGLGYRLVDLQVLRHDELAQMAELNTEHDFFKAPRRGNILDVNGNLLATSISVKTICANPSLIGNQQAVVAHALAPLLGMSEGSLCQRLVPRVWKNEKGETVTNGLYYVRLQKNVPDETWQKIQMTMTNLSFGVDESKLSRTNRAFFRNLRQGAIFAEADQLRVYPNGPLAAHVLGFVGSDEVTLSGTRISQLSGRDGIELDLNSALSGVAGWRVTETDRQKRELVALRDQDVQAARRPQCRAHPGFGHSAYCRNRAGRRHAEAHAHQHHRHRHASAHGRNPGDGDAAEF